MEKQSVPSVAHDVMSSVHRIKRFRLQDSSEPRPRLSEFISHHAEITIERALELLSFGAIYVNEKRELNDRQMDFGDHFRAHLDPKRYASRVEGWQENILYDDENLLVINKPSGLPVHAMLDNFVENVIHLLRPAKGNLYTTHRLDVDTSGVLILAKNPKAQAAVNKAFAERKVKKFYLAFTRNQNPIGELNHFMLKTERAPKIVFDHIPINESATSYLDCRMKILSSQRESTYFVSELELFTGRPHQIRVQLAKIGNPILGDTVYGGEVPWELSSNYSLGLICKKMEIELLDCKFVFETN